MTSPEAGSIPSIMQTAMQAANEMEKGHMQPMAALIYDIDGTNKVTVKDVKEMLNSAAKDLKTLQQYLHAAKVVVQKFENEDKEKKSMH